MQRLEITILLLVLISILFSCDDINSPNTITRTNIRGNTYDYSTRLPLPGVIIKIPDLELTSTSDSSGLYSFENIPVSSYLFYFEKLEYNTDSAFVNLSEEDSTVADQYLAFNSAFWSNPTQDAIYMTFNNSNSIRLDSTLAGKIQYRLEIARSFDPELDTIPAYPEWELGTLGIKIPDSTIYNKIDVKNVRFNHVSLDSISNSYGLYKIVILSVGPIKDGWLALYFPVKYNMEELGKEYEKIGVIEHAGVNGYGFLPEGPPSILQLEIDDPVYIFDFYLGGIFYPQNRHWEIHVVDNEIIYHFEE